MGSALPSMIAGHGVPCPYKCMGVALFMLSFRGISLRVGRRHPNYHAEEGIPRSAPFLCQGRRDDTNRRTQRQMGSALPSMIAGHGVPCPYSGKEETGRNCGEAWRKKRARPAKRDALDCDGSGGAHGAPNRR